MDWKELEKACCGCTACPLGKTRKNTVFGRGNRSARVLFVGEAPGETEDETGLPFVGAAGQLLDRYFEAVGISQDEIYIANILKCRPPRNRDPLPEEQQACLGYLRGQVRLINPGLIVCLGRISAQALIRPDFSVTREHGTFVRKGRFLVTAVYHPSALLRDPSKREETYADLKIVREYLVSSAEGTPPDTDVRP